MLIFASVLREGIEMRKGGFLPHPGPQLLDGGWRKCKVLGLGAYL